MVLDRVASLSLVDALLLLDVDEAVTDTIVFTRGRLLLEGLTMDELAILTHTAIHRLQVRKLLRRDILCVV